MVNNFININKSSNYSQKSENFLSKSKFYSNFFFNKVKYFEWRRLYKINRNFSLSKVPLRLRSKFFKKLYLRKNRNFFLKNYLFFYRKKNFVLKHNIIKNSLISILRKNSKLSRFYFSLLKNFFFKKKKNKSSFFLNKYKFAKNKSIKSKVSFNFNLGFTRRSLRLYNSIVLRRFKIIKRLKSKYYKNFSHLLLRYPSLRWLKDKRLTFRVFRFRKVLSSLEAQGLRRKVLRRRLTPFALALFDKQKLKNFYVGLKEYKLKNIIFSVFSKKSNHLDYFVSILESSLNSFLFRINISKNFYVLNSLVKRGLVFVNGFQILNPYYQLIPGDIVTLGLDSKKLMVLRKNFEKKVSLFFFPTNYIEISFSLFSFLFFKKPVISDIPYGFNINLSRILYYYNYRGLH